MSKRLLILSEDEWVTARALLLDLTEAGFHVETASCESVVVGRFGADAFDLLIVAGGRHGGECREVIEAFRRNYPAARVVLLTTDDVLAKSEDIGSESGEEEVVRVSMPFDLDSIRSLVFRLCDSERSATGNAT